MRTTALYFVLALFGAEAGFAQTTTQENLDALNALPPAESCRRIDFETAEVRPGFVTDTWFVAVSGTKPWITMEVELVPLIYVRQPEYWEIEVVGCQHGIGLPAEAPYSVVLPLDNVLGTKGIKIVGATRSEQLDVPPS